MRKLPLPCHRPDQAHAARCCSAHHQLHTHSGISSRHTRLQALTVNRNKKASAPWCLAGIPARQSYMCMIWYSARSPTHSTGSTAQHSIVIQSFRCAMKCEIPDLRECLRHRAGILIPGRNHTDTRQAGALPSGRKLTRCKLSCRGPRRRRRPQKLFRL